MMFGLSDKVIEELHSVFRRYANIEKVLIFGSRSKEYIYPRFRSTLV